MRLTALWSAGAAPSAALTWEAIVGTPPEQQESQPRVGVTRDIGTVLEGSAGLELRRSPGRVDWLLTPVLQVIVPINAQPSTFPSIGEVEDVSTSFSNLLFPRAAQSYDAVRFALGLTAHRHAASKEASYAELESLSKKTKFDIKGASDFLYQINRYRISTAVPGLMVNRLLRLSCAAVTDMQIAFPTEGSHSRNTGLPTFVTRMDLDINTEATRREPIPAAQRELLLAELKSLALEMLREGDVP